MRNKGLSLAWELTLVAILAVPGCTVQVGGGGDSPSTDNDNGGGDGNGGGNGSAGRVRLAPDVAGGNLAIGVDDQGNEYSFRSRQDALGRTFLTEANVRALDGRQLKVSLDDEGRPVNFRSSDNSAADLIYDGGSVRVRLTDAGGSVVADTSGLDPGAARERAATRRAARALRKQNVVSQTGFSLSLAVSDGLSNYEEVALSIFDAELNPGSPLVDVGFSQSALVLAEVVSVIEVVEVPPEEIIEIVVIDDTPEVFRQLAGQTYVLFDAEGSCVEETEAASRLTFDVHGLLQSEFDRRLVFPDLSFGGSPDPGITINYSTGTPINLTPEAATGFELFVTPIFTGTQVDDFGNFTIERRFAADAGFDSVVFGPALGPALRIFDAALVNGRLSAGGDVLDAELVLVDLADPTFVTTLGRVRYHNQNSARPQRVFDCNLITGEQVASRILCPESTNVGELLDVVFLAGRENEGRVLSFDWSVSEGYGLVLGEPTADQTEVVAVAPGFLELTLVVSDQSAHALAYQVYHCGVMVTEFDQPLPPPISALIIECPVGLNVGETGFLSVSGTDVEGLDGFDWFIFGTSDYYLSEPFKPFTEVEIYQPGKFEAAFRGFSAFGDELYVTCEIFVGGTEIDECAVNGFYGDGVCDEYCFQPDPDCDFFYDLCEINGWYSDGECDEFCPLSDPDCSAVILDICLEAGLYNDGSCDLFCPEPDPDCEFYDSCEENGWYGDGVCDRFCSLPDPDCETIDEGDFCAQLGYYGDGRCDLDCPEPDLDCNPGSIDICDVNEWYGDGECDEFCLLPDPDCD